MPRRRRLAGGSIVILMALLLAAPAALRAGQNSQHDFSALSTDSSGGASSADDIWMQVDAEIGLDGLWGSIDTEMDRDPFIVNGGATGVDHLLWARWDGLRHEVVHAWRPDGDVWYGPETVEVEPASAADSVTPRGALDDMGRLHVAWARQSSGSSAVYHAARLALGWTSPTLLSGGDVAFEPFVRLDGESTLVDYQTSLEIVTVEVTILGQSGGSDDIDPMTADVESTEVSRRLVPR